MGRISQTFRSLMPESLQTSRAAHNNAQGADNANRLDNRPSVFSALRHAGKGTFWSSLKRPSSWLRRNLQRNSSSQAAGAHPLTAVSPETNEVAVHPQTTASSDIGETNQQPPPITNLAPISLSAERLAYVMHQDHEATTAQSRASTRNDRFRANMAAGNTHIVLNGGLRTDPNCSLESAILQGIQGIHGGDSLRQDALILRIRMAHRFPVQVRENGLMSVNRNGEQMTWLRNDIYRNYGEQIDLRIVGADEDGMPTMEDMSPPLENHKLVVIWDQGDHYEALLREPPRDTLPESPLE